MKIILTILYKCMSKAHSKTLAVKVPLPMFDQFKELCDTNFKSMSDTIRDFIRDRVQNQIVVRYEDGSLGSVHISGLMRGVDGKTFISGDMLGQYQDRPCEVVKSFNPQHQFGGKHEV